MGKTTHIMVAGMTERERRRRDRQPRLVFVTSPAASPASRDVLDNVAQERAAINSARLARSQRGHARCLNDRDGHWRGRSRTSAWHWRNRNRTSAARHWYRRHGRRRTGGGNRATDSGKCAKWNPETRGHNRSFYTNRRPFRFISIPGWLAERSLQLQRMFNMNPRHALNGGSRHMLMTMDRCQFPTPCSHRRPDRRASPAQGLKFIPGLEQEGFGAHRTRLNLRLPFDDA